MKINKERTERVLRCISDEPKGYLIESGALAFALAAAGGFVEAD